MPVAFRRSFCLAIILAGLGLRALAIQKQPWFDEMQSLVYGSQNLETLLTLDQPPFHFWLNGVLGVDGIVLHARLVSLLWSVLFLVAIFIVCERHFPDGGPPALLVAATIPFLLRYGIEIRAYGLMVLLTTVAIALATEIREGADSAYLRIGLILSLMLCALTHGVGLLVAPAVALLVVRGKDDLPLALGATTFPSLATLTWYHFWDMKNKLGSTEWIEPFSPLALVRHSVKLMAGFDDQVVGLLGNAGQWLVASSLVSLFLVFAALFLRSSGGKIYLLAAALFLVEVLFVTIAVKPILLSRTMLPLLPFLIFFVAAGYHSLSSGRVRAFAAALVLWYALVGSYRWVSTYAEAPIQDYESSLPSIRAALMESQVVLNTSVTNQILDFYFAEQTVDRIVLRAGTPRSILDKATAGQECVVLVTASWMQQELNAKLRAHLGEWGVEEVVTKSGPLRCFLYRRGSRISSPTPENTNSWTSSPQEGC